MITQVRRNSCRQLALAAPAVEAVIQKCGEVSHKASSAHACRLISLKALGALGTLHSM